MSLVVDDTLDIARDWHRDRSKLWVPEAERLRAQGMRFSDIAKRIGKAPATVSNYMSLELTTLSNEDLAHLRKVACPVTSVPDVVREARYARWGRAEQRRLERKARRKQAQPRLKCELSRRRGRAWRRAFQELLCAYKGRSLSWVDRLAWEAEFAEWWSPQAREFSREWWGREWPKESERLAAKEQRQRERAQHRYRWREIPPERISFDFDNPDGFSIRERLADPSILGRDPLLILTDENPLEEILGDLAIEDVARMDEHALEHLRERIREAGIAPSSVQRAERERLRDPLPHRGHSTSRDHGAMSSGRGRTRKEQSASHKGRDRRFKRHEKHSKRDGWGELAGLD